MRRACRFSVSLQRVASERLLLLPHKEYHQRIPPKNVTKEYQFTPPNKHLPPATSPRYMPSLRSPLHRYIFVGAEADRNHFASRFPTPPSLTLSHPLSPYLTSSPCPPPHHNSPPLPSPPPPSPATPPPPASSASPTTSTVESTPPSPPPLDWLSLPIPLPSQPHSPPL